MKIDKEVIAQLTAAFGKKKAKALAREIRAIKKKHPTMVFSFIFDEDGSVHAVPKAVQEEEEEVGEEEHDRR